MITIEELRQMNLVYDRRYGVSDVDLEKANRHIKTIERWLKTTVPMVGDLVEGEYYGKHPFKRGIICNTKADGDVFEVCYQPYTPFTTTDDMRVWLSVSGGPFGSFHRSRFEFVGYDTRKFCDFGHNGPCAGGAFDFPAKVKRWRVKPFEVEYIHLGDKDVVIVENPIITKAAEYRLYMYQGYLMNVRFVNGGDVNGVAVYNGVGVETTLQAMDYWIGNQKSSLSPVMMSLKRLVNEWLDIKESSVKTDNPDNLQKPARVVCASEEITGSPALRLQLFDGEFVDVNDYVGMKIFGY